MMRAEGEEGRLQPGKKRRTNDETAGDDEQGSDKR
jgi:hypothetical protein